MPVNQQLITSIAQLIELSKPIEEHFGAERVSNLPAAVRAAAHEGLMSPEQVGPLVELAHFAYDLPAWLARDGQQAFIASCQEALADWQEGAAAAGLRKVS